VVPGQPHHVTQRGNGRARNFFRDEDSQLYRDLLTASCRAAEVEVWAWVLMPNPMQLILTPGDEDGLRRALAPTHRRYAGYLHAREAHTGHFWQCRFGAVVMDEDHRGAAVRYIAMLESLTKRALKPAKRGQKPSPGDKISEVLIQCTFTGTSHRPVTSNISRVFVAPPPLQR
jgi:REP element-mobilizing transposase RayT